MNALIVNCSPVRNGATAEIAGIIARQLSECFAVRSVCIDDYRFAFCRGCRSCHQTAECVMHDDAEKLMAAFEWLEIQCSGHLGLCSVEYREAVEARQEEIEAFCRMIMEKRERTDEA